MASLYQDIGAEHSDTALKWFIEISIAILTLEKLPHRCPSTPEKSNLRHMLYGKRPHVYRVIYRILEKQKLVEILHIRHGARRGFKASDIES